MDERVKFNVGGRLFETTHSTILKYPDSVLAKHIGPLGKPDAEGVYFIDRNPNVFEAILDYYRSGLLACPPNVHPDVFTSELGFWGIDVPEDPSEGCNRSDDEDETKEQDLSIYKMSDFLEGLARSWDKPYSPNYTHDVILTINQAICRAQNNHLNAIVIGIPYYDERTWIDDPYTKRKSEYVEYDKKKYLDALETYFNFSQILVETLPIVEKYPHSYLYLNDFVDDKKIWEFQDEEVYQTDKGSRVLAIIAYF